MAFYDVHKSSALGEATIFRTAQQVATDIETYGQDAGDIAKQGGLKNMENVFKFSAARGRLNDLQAEVVATENRLISLQAQMDAKIAELEKLGAPNVGTYLKMGAQAVVAFALPFVSAAWGFFGGAADKKKMEKKAKALIGELDALKKQADFWNERLGKLNAEGQKLAMEFDKGPSAVEVKLIGLPQKTENKLKAVGGSGMATTFIREKKIVDVKDPFFKVADELAERTAFKTGDRLPVGFQTIYSPAIKGGPIVAKVTSTSDALTQPVGKKVVYGGLLSGIDEFPTGPLIVAGMFGLAAYLLTRKI